MVVTKIKEKEENCRENWGHDDGDFSGFSLHFGIPHLNEDWLLVMINIYIYIYIYIYI